MRLVFASWWKLWWLLCFVLAATSCTGQPTAVTKTAQVDGITIGFEHPQSAALMQTYDIFITLRDANEQPINGADVALDLTMPAMSMGSNKPVADAAGDGRYRITTAYTMEGDWIITVFVEANGKRVQATFDQIVKPQ